jgi:hypothetical protein
MFSASSRAGTTTAIGGHPELAASEAGARRRNAKFWRSARPISQTTMASQTRELTSATARPLAGANVQHADGFQTRSKFAVLKRVIHARQKLISIFCLSPPPSVAIIRELSGLPFRCEQDSIVPP